MTRTSTVITSTTLGRSLRISGYPPEPLVDRHGKPVTEFHPVVVGFALDDDGDVMDRYRTLTPEQAREAAVALLRAADVAEGGLEAEPGHDDGKTLIAGVLYDDETGEEADPQ